MKHTRHHNRLVPVLAVVVAGGLAGYGGAAAVSGLADGERDPRSPSRELVRYAHDHHLTGLSPASLQPYGNNDLAIRPDGVRGTACERAVLDPCRDDERGRP